MAPELPEEGWYRDPVDPTRRRWWDGEQWTTILTRPLAELGAPAAPAAAPTPASTSAPVMGDGTMLPYATDARPKEPVGEDASSGDEPSNRPSRVRVLQVLLALVAILATAAVVYSGPGDDPAPETADTSFEGPGLTVAPTTETVAPTTTEAAPDPETGPASETESETDPETETETVEAPSFRDAYAGCQAILDGSSIGSGGMDYQTFRDIEAVSQDGITELRFEATDAGGDSEVYLCRTLLNGSTGSVMVGRLYLDLQNALGG
jgi:hypothetical protein